MKIGVNDGKDPHKNTTDYFATGQLYLWKKIGATKVTRFGGKAIETPPVFNLEREIWMDRESIESFQLLLPPRGHSVVFLSCCKPTRLTYSWNGFHNGARSLCRICRRINLNILHAVSILSEAALVPISAADACSRGGR